MPAPLNTPGDNEEELAPAEDPVEPECIGCDSESGSGCVKVDCCSKKNMNVTEK